MNLQIRQAICEMFHRGQWWGCEVAPRPGDDDDAMRFHMNCTNCRRWWVSVHNQQPDPRRNERNCEVFGTQCAREWKRQVIALGL
jgi:hypothetical protein